MKTFDVRIPSTNHRFQARDNETILEAALRQGIAMPYGCRGGSCGSCIGKILTGEVHYLQTPNLFKAASPNPGQALFCMAHACSDLEIQVPELRPDQQIEPRIYRCKVVKLERLAHDVSRVYLKVAGNQRPRFHAGQYLDILQDDGSNRSFSIANAPHEDRFLELHIRHVPDGAFSQYVYSRMREGDMVRIRAPLGSFFLRENSDRPILLMGGGTGFAPLRGIISHALFTGVKRPIHLFWGVRSVRDLYLQKLVQSWTEQNQNITYTPVLSDPLTEDHWQGERGWVHEILLNKYPDLTLHDVYMSGPPPMIYAARDAFIKHGLPEQHLYSDAFEYNSHPDIE